MRRLVAYVTALAVVGCTAPPWAAHAGMGWRWPSEPRVGYSTPVLREPVAQALAQWRYGTLVEGCSGVDVCVTAGVAHHAGPRGSRCFAEIAVGHDAQGRQRFSVRVVAHEIGHCYGLPHSTDPSSVMCSSGDARLGVTCDAQRNGVTDADREQLHAPR